MKMVSKILLIDGMSCQHCVMELKKQLSKLDIKIKDIQIGSAEIDYDENKISNAQFEEAVKEAGFTIKN
jgi:copper chaperone CopZ